MKPPPSPIEPPTSSNDVQVVPTGKDLVENSSTLSDPLIPIARPELVFGIVGPLGGNLPELSKCLKRSLRDVGYKTEEIKLSGLIRELEPFKDLPKGTEEIRIKAHMKAGTEIRTKIGRGDALAMMAVAKIREFRSKMNSEGEADPPIPSQAYILNSLKHPDEAIALRKIYGRLFILISAYLPRAKRVDGLARTIARSYGKSADAQKYREQAESLINIDEEEEGENLGQDVSDVFPQADFFVSTENAVDLAGEVKRFIEILFGFQFHTPTRDEMGMYLARSAALRSSDLSRQVGAAICNASGDLLSVGCNEVPRAGGGQYWPSKTENDNRDFQRGYDSSTYSKDEIIREVVSRLKGLNIFDKDFSDENKISEILLSGKGKDILKGTQVFNLLEFGRPVHAEMAAITNAAKLGISIRGTNLYSTVFPCHMCARHVISSGIKRVVYIEPYPKSRVKDLYDDSASIDETVDDGRVLFCPFVGIAPRRYQEFFEMSQKRKDDRGNVKEWDARSPSPRIERVIPTYPYLEQGVVGFVASLLKEKGFIS